MAHFACITLPYLGHINPMATLARELERRGHTTTFLNIAEVAPTIARQGLGFVPLGRKTHPLGWRETAMRQLGRVDGPFRLGAVMRDFASLTAMFCDELPAALRTLSIDMILTDQYEAAGGLAAYHMDLPFISLAAALPLNWDDSVPSPFVGWGPGDTRWHRWRNIAGAYAAKRMREPVNAVIGHYAERWRLAQGRQIEHYMSGLAQISQLVPALDFPRRALIGCFHYCGPLRDAPAPPRNASSGRAFASLGTLQGHRADVFAKISQATRLSGLDLTIAHGGRLAPNAAARLARHADVETYVAQDEVLAASDIAILHGGLNTVLDALAAGTPLVVIPLAFEQGAIAARVKRAGAGLVVSRHGLSSRRLTAAITRVHGDPAFAQAAARLRAAIGASGGTARAADIVEYVQATGRPALSELRDASAAEVPAAS